MNKRGPKPRIICPRCGELKYGYEMVDDEDFGYICDDCLSNEIDEEASGEEWALLEAYGYTEDLDPDDDEAIGQAYEELMEHLMRD